MGYNLPKISVVKSIDSHVLKSLLEGALKCGLPVSSVNVATVLGTTYDIAVKGDQFDLEVLVSIFELDATLLTQIRLAFQTNGSVTFRRKAEQTTDEVEFNLQNWTTSVVDVEVLLMRFVAHIKRELVAIDSKEYVASILGTELSGYYQCREAELGKLMTLSESVTTKTSEFRDKLQEDFAKRADELNSDFRSQREVLLSEFAVKEQELQERETALQTKLQEIDDRENRHVRRDLRDKFLSNLKERQQTFILTKGTRRLRLPIHIAAWAVIALLVLANWKTFGLFEMLDQFSGYQLGLLIAKQSTLGLAFGSTVVFYLRWCNLWFQQHAAEEFHHKRLELDIDRASWVVEVALEWKHETGETLPVDLLDRLSVELFTSSECKTDENIHPADQIASAILGNSAKATIKVGDNEVVIDKKGLKALLKGVGS